MNRGYAVSKATDSTEASGSFLTRDFGAQGDENQVQKRGSGKETGDLG